MESVALESSGTGQGRQVEGVSTDKAWSSQGGLGQENGVLREGWGAKHGAGEA